MFICHVEQVNYANFFKDLSLDKIGIGIAQIDNKLVPYLRIKEKGKLRTWCCTDGFSILDYRTSNVNT